MVISASLVRAPSSRGAGRNCGRCWCPATLQPKRSHSTTIATLRKSHSCPRFF